MRGYIRERGKNSWQIQIYTGTGADGSPVRHVETVRGRKGDAQRRMTELLSSLDKGVYTPPGRVTVAVHLKNWLDGYVKTNCSARTLDGYTSIINKHIIPALGQIQLKNLSAQAIQAYYSKQCEKLSARTVHHQHRVLSQSLKYAVRQGYLGRNPCDLADAPSAKKKVMRTLTPFEAVILLKQAEGSYYYPVIYTAISTGLRQAELLGLRWRDLYLPRKDEKDGKAALSVCQVLYKRRGVCIFKEPKTQHSRRRVAMTPNLALFLRKYHEERVLLYMETGQQFTLDDLVFASHEGKPIDPGVLGHNFKRIARKAGLEKMRFHDLRHTFASLTLMKGISPKVISEALGHASVAFTMDTYSHIIPGMQESAMALLNESLPAGVNHAAKQNSVNLTSTDDIKLDESP